MAQEKPPHETPFKPGKTTSVSPRQDLVSHRMTVGALSAVAIIATLGAIWLAGNKIDIPQVLTALGAGAVGGLAGLLKR